MFYDPQYQQQKIEADPFSVAWLIAWLEMRPAAQEYDPKRPNYCILAQWLTARGVEPHKVARKSFELGMQEPFNKIALHKPYTFGDALERACAEQRS